MYQTFLRKLPGAWIIIVILLMFQTHCAPTPYMTFQEKASQLKQLEHKIASATHLPELPTIVRYDLLGLTVAPNQGCPLNPLYQALYIENVTKEVFEKRLEQAKLKLAQRLEASPSSEYHWQKQLLHALQKRNDSWQNAMRKSQLSHLLSTRHHPDIKSTLYALQQMEEHLLFPDSGAFAALSLPQGEGDAEHAELSALHHALQTIEASSQILDRMPLAAPLKKAIITGNYGTRNDPIHGRKAQHEGLDLSDHRGASVFATGGGTVSFAGSQTGYGNLIKIDHGFGLSTRYAHLDKLIVQAGDTVVMGQMIGIQGNTGRSTGSHLHYEVRYEGKTKNPRTFFQARPDCYW